MNSTFNLGHLLRPNSTPARRRKNSGVRGETIYLRQRICLFSGISKFDDSNGLKILSAWTSFNSSLEAAGSKGLRVSIPNYRCLWLVTDESVSTDRGAFPNGATESNGADETRSSDVNGWISTNASLLESWIYPRLLLINPIIRYWCMMARNLMR